MFIGVFWPVGVRGGGRGADGRERWSVGVRAGEVESPNKRAKKTISAKGVKYFCLINGLGIVLTSDLLLGE